MNMKKEGTKIHADTYSKRASRKVFKTKYNNSIIPYYNKEKKKALKNAGSLMFYPKN